MVFPIVAASSIGGLAGAGPHGVTIMPCAIGDVILVWGGIADTPAGDAIAGFDTIANLYPGNDPSYLGRRVVDGTEPWYNGGAGGSAVMTHNAAADGCTLQIIRVTGADPAAYTPLIVPSAGITSGAVADTHPDPPALAPAWSAADTLWMAAYTQHDGSANTLGYPAGYTAIGSWGFGGSFIGVHMGIGYRNAVAATSENPGTFTTDVTGGAGLTAMTFGMRALAAPSVPSPAQRSGPLRRFRRY